MNIVITILCFLSLMLFLLWRRSVKLLKNTKFAKSSLASKYGKTTEQFMPFLKNYPYDPSNFRFLGTPIDGVQFNENGIVFIEFKTAESKLSSKQRLIRDNIISKNISYKEIRI